MARILAACLLMASASGLALAQPMGDMQLVSSKTSIQAVVGEEDGEGLWVVTNDGTNYSVWTPEEVSLDELSTFQQTYKNKEVTLIGDVYKDKYGNLNLFVKNLPK
jgi:SHS2 domain-containing protein